MLSQVKKITDPKARKEFAGRFGAWWDGREYEPELEEAAEAAGEAGEGQAPQRTEMTPADPSADGPRIAALERMWGLGRFGPDATDEEVLSALERGMLVDGDVGMMGADPALLRAWGERSERTVLASEWRAAAIERVRSAVPDMTVINDDVDRLKAFPEDTLAALASVNTMAFADHKPGLVSSAYHALKDGGRWVVVDTVRTTPKTPQAAFASAWAEPQLAEEGEFDDLLEKAGFGEVRKSNLTPVMIERVRAQLVELGAALETTVSEGMNGGGALFLRELVWELKSWRSRLKALEGGALQVVMWSTVKGGAPGLAVEDEEEGWVEVATDEGDNSGLEVSEMSGDSLEDELAGALAAGAEGDAETGVDDDLFDENT